MIRLEMDRPDFENDIRAVLMSFYPGEKILSPQQTARLRDRSADRQTAVFSVLYEQEETVCLTIREEGWADGDENSSMDLKKEGSRSVRIPVTDAEGKILQGGDLRDAIKDAMYRLLSAQTGKTLPWGTLTGVRPTKIPMEMLERGSRPDEAARFMEDRYRVSHEKAGLAAQVAERELSLIRPLYERAGAAYDPEQPCPGYSLYLGIPFCPSVCAYCSFSSFPLKEWKDRIGQYLQALETEIRQTGRLMEETGAGRAPVTFYMGGGTPTSLSPDELDRVLTSLEETFDLDLCLEKTVEAGRPDSITAAKLRVLKAHGIDRISINPQTMHQETLDRIGRRHTADQIREAFYLAREEGFSNINMDIIAGLPGETPRHMEETMQQICSMGPDSITVHSLALKRAADMNRSRDSSLPASHEAAGRMVEIAHTMALGAGLLPYYLYRQKNIAGNLENVGFAREGEECLYNIIIMEEIQSIAALGSGSISKRVWPGHRIGRSANVKSVTDYMERIEEMNTRKRKLFS